MRQGPTDAPNFALLEATRPPPANSPDGAWIRVLYGWLASYDSAHTREAYLRDVGQWSQWLADHAGVVPWEATRPLAAGWRHHLTATRELKVSTVARKLSAVCSLYEFALEEAAVDSNPFARLRRPTVSTDEAGTSGLDRASAAGLLAAAAAAGPRDHAAVCLLLLNGLRASELCAASVEDLGEIRGYRVLTTVAKGGRVRIHRLAARTAAAIDDHLDEAQARLVSVSDEGAVRPLIADNAGERLSRHQLARIVARLANHAGLSSDPTPHTLRHTAATLALDAGAALRDVQDMLGHADPTTTRRYDSGRYSLDRHPTELLALHLMDRNAPLSQNANASHDRE